MRAAHPRLRRERLPFRLLLYFLPPRVWNSARFEIRLALLRLLKPRRDRRFASESNLMVNVGSGASGKIGWVNIDMYAAPRVTCLADIRRNLPLYDDSARAIFTEHLVEHLEYEDDIPTFLSECLRVLQPGGTLRVIVPDGERYLSAYSSRSLSAFDFSPIGAVGPDTAMEIVNRHFRQSGQHRFSWDAETLVKALERVRFVGVEESVYGGSRLSGLAIDSPSRSNESLYVEAAKPNR